METWIEDEWSENFGGKVYDLKNSYTLATNIHGNDYEANMAEMM